MNAFTPEDLDRAFVPVGTPTLGDLIHRIESDQCLEAIRKRDLASGLRCLSRVLGLPVSGIPADTAWLRPRIARVNPAAHGISAKTWRNHRSNANAALEHCGILERTRGRYVALTPAWQELHDAAHQSGDPGHHAFGRFLRFLSKLDIAPEDVGDAHLDAFRTALEINELTKDPAKTVWNTVNAWEHAQRNLLSWPQRRLTKPARHNHYAFGLSAFPTGFQDDLTLYLDNLASPDPLESDRPLRTLRPATVASHRSNLLRFASALVHAGIPVEELNTLDALFAEDRPKIGLRWLIERLADRTAPSLQQICFSLCVLADRGLNNPDYLTTARDLARRVKPHKRRGMTEKNARRLRQFGDRAKLLRLLSIPDAALRNARERDLPPRDLATALAIGILLTLPLRLVNLSSIHLETNLQRLSNGTIHLVFPDHEVKNGMPLEMQLGAETAALLDLYLKDHRPRICAHSSPWLFPQRDGDKPIHPNHMGRSITRLLARQGIEMNTHLFRHLCAALVLDRDPAAFELVRQLLGHGARSTTLDLYAGLGTARSGRAFADLLRRLKDEDDDDDT